ncbi:PH domain-containing protein [Dermacoccaceae bacterium W4C1]
MSLDTPPRSLREPAHRVSAKARPYWAVQAAAWWGFLAVGQGVSMLIWDDVALWRWGLLALTIAVFIVDTFISPLVRYRVHRWEVTDTAVYTRSGWLSQELRIAPISRVQTIDSEQGLLMRLFGLSSVTVTTASSAGALAIEGLDAAVAARLVEQLTAITEQIPDDAT